MADTDAGGYFRGVTFPEDTSITAPWPSLMFKAGRRSPGAAMTNVLIAALPCMALGLVLAFTYPAAAQTPVHFLVLAYILATILIHRNMTRPVMVVRLDNGRVCVDEQRWWRDQERQLPDSIKRWDEARKRRIAWLYPVEGEEEVDGPDGKKVKAPVQWLMPFDAWGEQLEVKAGDASAAHVAGIKTTMLASEHLARHQEPDGREMVRHGLLALLVAIGLLATYMAGSRALETFPSP